MVDETIISMITIIEAAALLDGKIYTGKRHSDIIRRLKTRISFRRQGFITSENKWVDREEAAKIAFEAGQIKEMKRELFSEDLY